jgi:hypothetical protein
MSETAEEVLSIAEGQMIASSSAMGESLAVHAAVMQSITFRFGVDGEP